MRFAIMTWVPTSDNAKIGTIFGIVNNDAPGTLPLLPTGHWELYHVADETTLTCAAEAGRAITHHGYYLLGAGETPSEAFGA